MPRNHFQHFKFEWLSFIIISVILAGLFSYHVFYRYDLLISQEKKQFQHAAEASQSVISKQLTNINIILDNVRVDFIPRWEGKTAQLKHTRLKELASVIPNVQAVMIMNKDGVISSSSKMPLIGQSFAHRDYFLAAKRTPDMETLYVSPPFQGVYGDWLIGLSKIVIGKGGKFNGVVVILLNAKDYSESLNILRPTADSWASLAHANGILFAWEPSNHAMTGKNLSIKGSLFNQHIQSGNSASLFSDIVAANNKVSLVAIRTINPVNLYMNKPLILGIGRSLDVLYQTIYKDIFFYSAIFLMINLVSSISLFASQRSRLAANLKTIEAEIGIHTLNQQLTNLFDLTPSFMLLTNTNGSYRKLNPIWQKTLGYSKEELDNTSLFNLIHHEDKNKIQLMISGLQEGVPEKNILLRLVNKKNKFHYMEASFVLQKNMLFITALDVTDRELEKKRLSSLAYHDRLTGLPNRSLLFDRLSQVIAVDERETWKSSLMFIDLDGFKAINDQYGHDIGDTVLQTIANRLKSLVRNVDTVSRYGGDEFVIILHRISSINDSVVVAQKMIEAVRQDIKIDNNLKVNVGVSIGIAIWPDNGNTPDELLNAADRAMYISKEKGKNTFTSV